MKLSDFDYHLPEELIAQTAIEPRDSAKLFCFNKDNLEKEHLHVSDLVNLLNENHVLVFNKSRVIPARIKFGGNKEVLLCKRTEYSYQVIKLSSYKVKDLKDGEYENTWEVMVRLGKKNKVGDIHQIDEEVGFEILEILEGGTRIVRFFNCSNKTPLPPLQRGAIGAFNFFEWLQRHGEMPLPPYIKQKSDNERYQTKFSKEGDGMSVAAPTAGLHFTDELLDKLKKKGVQIEFVHLDVGLGTFLPVKTENILDHKIHHESFSIDQDTADRLKKAKLEGKKIVAVGTTTIRVLETVADLVESGKLKVESFTNEKFGPSLRSRLAGEDNLSESKINSNHKIASSQNSSSQGQGYQLSAFSGETNIFIYPGYQWKFVDEIITNFHLPKSSLLMLISAFIGREKLFELYKEAIDKKYRFYSFGDTMYLNSCHSGK